MVGCNVKKMEECLDSPQSTVSQHLGRLRAVGVVKAERRGVEKVYRVADDRIEGIIQSLFKGGEL